MKCPDSGEQETVFSPGSVISSLCDFGQIVSIPEK